MDDFSATLKYQEALKTVLNYLSHQELTPTKMAAQDDLSDIAGIFLRKIGFLYCINAKRQTLLHFVTSCIHPYRQHLLVDFLLKAGERADTADIDGRTPLHIAAGAGREEQLAVVELLLNAGADAKAQDEDGITPLHAAIKVPGTHQLAVIELLLKRGANVNAQEDTGLTPLQLAVTERGTHQLAITELLLRNGADVNAQDNIGFTALHFAARRAKDQQLLYLLTQCGASTDQKDKKQRTPEDIAVSHRQTQAIAFFKSLK